ncbi:hypothetical protein SAMN05216573_12140 [Bradyrhizobium sp. Rc3b]|nr:hypothetical protein SAMN05216573_12140 [Bradyrhizobium sp. Rc3b]
MVDAEASVIARPPLAFDNAWRQRRSIVYVTNPRGLDFDRAAVKADPPRSSNHVSLQIFSLSLLGERQLRCQVTVGAPVSCCSAGLGSNVDATECQFTRCRCRKPGPVGRLISVRTLRSCLVFGLSHNASSFLRTAKVLSRDRKVRASAASYKCHLARAIDARGGSIQPALISDKARGNDARVKHEQVNDKAFSQLGPIVHTHLHSCLLRRKSARPPDYHRTCCTS